MSRARAALVAVLAAVLTLGAAAGAVAAPTAPAATPAPQPTGTPGVRAADDALSVTLDAVGPPVVTPGSTLTVRAVVTNGTRETVEAANVELSVRRQRSSTRSALQEWVTGEAGTGRVMKTVPLAEPLAPRASRPVDLSIPADQLNLSGASFGPRGLAVVVRDADGDRRAVTRSFVIWQNAPGGYDPTRISVLLPLTGPPPDIATGRLSAAELARLTGPGGRLRTLLDAGARPGVTWAVDPALLEWADPAAHPDTADPDTADPDSTDPAAPSGGGASPGPTSGDGQPALQQWRDDVRSRSAGHDVVALPYGDPDSAALAHAGQHRAYELAEDIGRQTVQRLLPSARSDVAWPVTGTLDDATLGMLREAGRTSVVLSGGAQPLLERLRTTPTGRSTITLPGGTVAGLLVDTQLSTTLARTDTRQLVAEDRDGVGENGEASQEDPGGPAAVQRLLAETAAITMERPFDSRHILVTAPRGWDPEPADAVAAVQALTTVPWLDPRPLRDLRRLDAPDVERGPLSYRTQDRADELDTATLRAAASATARIREIATVLPDPNPVSEGADRSLVAASSAGWRSRTDDWRAGVAELGAQAQRLSGAVTVLEGSQLTVVSSDVQLPITLRNQLDEPAAVTVRLRPRSSRLVVERTQSVTIQPDSEQRLLVPVKAVGNGDTEVVVELFTPTGQPLGAPATMRVRVRADWETVGTLVTGVVVGLVLVVGLVRAVLRGRRQRALQDPLAGLPGRPVEEPRG